MLSLLLFSCKVMTSSSGGSIWSIEGVFGVSITNFTSIYMSLVLYPIFGEVCTPYFHDHKKDEFLGLEQGICLLQPIRLSFMLIRMRFWTLSRVICLL